MSYLDPKNPCTQDICTDKKTCGEIPGLLERLCKGCAKLDERIESLAARLTPVLSHETSRVETENGDNCQSSIGNQLNGYILRIAASCSDIEDLIERCQL